MKKITFVFLAALLFMPCFGCGGGSSSSSNNPIPTPTPTPTPAPTPSSAPSWTLIGNTGMASTTGIVFDNIGTMYAASSVDRGVGGLARSLDKGVTWSPIMSGIDLSVGCGNFKNFGIAPDGTLFIMNGGCALSGKVNFAYYLDNVNGTGTHWTKAATTPPIGFFGIETGCATAGNGVTIICPIGTGWVLLSNDNARTWTQAPSGPVGTAELFSALTIGNVSFLTAAVPTTPPAASGAWYSLDNGSTWLPLGMPPGIAFAGDAWAQAVAGEGPNSGRMMYFQGDGSVATGFWCWNGVPPSGSWVFCGNNDGLNQPKDVVTSVVTNRTHNRTIAVKAAGQGLKPIYTDDGSNWNDASSGLICTSPATPVCGKSGGPETSHVAMDPTTGIFYISMSPGDIWQTTVSQDH
jgi:hypothetical protein